MKFETNKKTGISAMLTTLLGLPLKTLGNSFDTGVEQFGEFSKVQGSIYGVPKEYSPSDNKFSGPLIIFDFILVIITFFVGIISFFKIRKIEDKDLKRKWIKRTCLIIFSLLFIAVLLFLLMLNDDNSLL